MSEGIGIRAYRDDDLPAVLDLLRAALGETTLLQRTAELFRWKHVENPFGRSVALVAEADDKIVGLRAFMRWNLEWDGTVIRCGRAVDTATHPAYHRRGIFKNLTTAAVDIARERGIQLIFNTPNDRSRPGYLKMGWKDVGPIRVLVRPHPGRLASGRRESFPRLDELAPGATPIGADWQPAADQGSHSETRDVLATPRSVEYLQWRFGMHPTARYGEVVAGGASAIVRANLRGGRSELVISDTLGTDPTAAIRAVVRQSRAAYDVATFPSRSATRAAALRSGMVAIPGITALTLVARPIVAVEPDVFDLRHWHLSLGDLELL